MKSSELLKKAKTFIDEPSKWTQGAFARDKHGNSIDASLHDKATCFCSWGALMRIDDGRLLTTQTRKLLIRLDRAADPSGEIGIVSFNDNNSHQDVMAIWDKVIKQLESEGD